MKHFNTTPHVSRYRSLLAQERGLKRVGVYISYSCGWSLLAQERGLKLDNALKDELFLKSLLAQERGLKHFCGYGKRRG